MYVLDGFGKTWRLEDKGDGLSVYPEDQSFHDVKQKWNELVRCQKFLTQVFATVHGDMVQPAPHVIQYTTSSGKHRTAECYDTDVLSQLSDESTLRFKPPAHVTTKSSPASVKWIPCVKWGTRSRMPLGWTPPVAHTTPVCDSCGKKTKSTKLVQVCDSCGKKTKSTKLVQVCDKKEPKENNLVQVCDKKEPKENNLVQVCDKKEPKENNLVQVCVAEKITYVPDPDGHDLKDRPYDTQHNGRDNGDEPTAPVMLKPSEEEIKRVEEYLMSRGALKVIPKKASFDGKKWSKPVKSPPKPVVKKPTPRFKRAPGLQWSRPSPSAANQTRVVKLDEPERESTPKFRF